MADPLLKTFDLLATTKASAAVDVLLVALDSPLGALQQRAAASLLRRGGTRCQTEVIRRLPKLNPASRKILEEQGQRLSVTLRQCLLHGDADLRGVAFALTVSGQYYDQVGSLVQILEQKDDPYQEAAVKTLKELVNRLSDSLHGPGRKSNDPRNPGQARQTMLASLEDACNRFGGLAHADAVVESILALGDPENFAVRKVLVQGVPECRDLAAEILMTSKHPGVLRLLTEFMGQNYPHPKALQAIEKRSDIEFVTHLLRTFPSRPSENQLKNYKQVGRIDWISDERLPLENIPEGLQEQLVAFLQATSIDVGDKIEICKWLLLHGNMRARLAASEILETLDPDSVKDLLADSLDAQDEDVQAWATSQLRAQGVPEAIKLLVERLDSPHAAVRDAARGELESFNIEMMLNIFDQFDSSMGLKVGSLVRKVDANCTQKLMDELNSPVRQKRIRAARAAQVLGLARDVEAGLVPMLSDPDTHVRRTAAEVLVAVPTPQVTSHLVRLLDDPSPRVRETAENSLQAMERAGVRGATAAPATNQSAT